MTGRPGGGSAFESAIPLGMGDFRKIMDPDWFCLRNFHCSLYEDSDVLDSYLGHQRQSLQDHYQQVLDAAPGYVRWVVWCRAPSSST